MNEHPGCAAMRDALVKSLKAAIQALEDPAVGHALIENAGCELAAVVGEVTEVIADFARSEAGATIARARASTTLAEDANFFDNHKQIDA